MPIQRGEGRWHLNGLGHPVVPQVWSLVFMAYTPAQGGWRLGLGWEGYDLCLRPTLSLIPQSTAPSMPVLTPSLENKGLGKACVEMPYWGV